MNSVLQKEVVALEYLARILTCIVAGMILGQAALLVPYVWFLFRFRRPALADDKCPRAAVILCVRGLDPFLPACLNGLFQQDYPDYDVWIVVDSTRDAAWPVVNELARQCGKHEVHVLALTERLVTCSRKVASILQAMSNLNASHEIVAFLDSDTIPHAAWLRGLAAPLQDPRVGVASGNRWYMPAAPTAGSLVRYLWNVAAVVQMYWYDIGWGGSLAIRGKFLRESDLPRRLANGFSDDTTICRCARAYGYRLAFSPSLVMVNRETCSVQGVFGFLQRQLLAVRIAKPLVVGRRWTRPRHDRRAGAFLPAGRGGRGGSQLDCRGLDRHGPGRLLGLDGLPGSSLGVVRAAHRPRTRRRRSRDSGPGAGSAPP